LDKGSELKKRVVTRYTDSGVRCLIGRARTGSTINMRYVIWSVVTPLKAPESSAVFVLLKEETRLAHHRLSLAELDAKRTLE